MWADPSGDARMTAAGRPGVGGRHATVRHRCSYLTFTPGPDRVRGAYGDETYARLVPLKNLYDPAILFRLNQNNRPGHPAAVG
ncbi:BBE domain-containing protein [Streptomyces sp. NPDC050416]|uniref:BBE domain-containing protein n=1 Tax=Streptomyces sp. NPDC050416 TaxID=3365611 RepID=UPI0037AEA766